MREVAQQDTSLCDELRDGCAGPQVEVARRRSPPVFDTVPRQDKRELAVKLAGVCRKGVRGDDDVGIRDSLHGIGQAEQAARKADGRGGLCADAGPA